MKQTSGETTVVQNANDLFSQGWMSHGCPYWKHVIWAAGKIQLARTPVIFSYGWTGHVHVAHDRVWVHYARSLMYSLYSTAGGLATVSLYLATVSIYLTTISVYVATVSLSIYMACLSMSTLSSQPTNKQTIASLQSPCSLVLGRVVVLSL